VHAPVAGQRVLAEEVGQLGAQQAQLALLVLVVEDLVADPQRDVSAARAAFVGLGVEVVDGGWAGARRSGDHADRGERGTRNAGACRRPHRPGLIL